MTLKKLFIIYFCLICSQTTLAQNSIEQIQAGFIEGALNEVLIKDSVASYTHLLTLKQQLNSFKNTPNQALLTQIQTEFKQLLIAWKAVETVYIAGMIDEDLLDHPRYIDFFHQANESIPKLLKRALNSDHSLKKALFKNSTKSINALEFLLFIKNNDALLSLMQQQNFRRIDASLIVVNNMQMWLGEIVEFYQNDQKLKADPALSLGLIVNSLIDSSYKLVNWRVGEAGGLVKKHFGKPSVKHLEYGLSHSSLLAIKSILKTHRKIIDREGENDLLAIAEINKVTSDLVFIRQTIDDAIALCDTFSTPILYNLHHPNYIKLYKKLEQLHNGYYFLLIDALGLSANIIDADGD